MVVLFLVFFFFNLHTVLHGGYINLHSHQQCKAKWKSHSHVWLSVTLWTATYQAPLSMGFSRQEHCKWVAISFSRGASQPRDWTWVSHIAGRLITIWAIREYLSYNPTISLLNTYFEKTIILKDIYTPILIAALFAIARTWKHVWCPSTN